MGLRAWVREVRIEGVGRGYFACDVRGVDGLAWIWVL